MRATGGARTTNENVFRLLEHVVGQSGVVVIVVVIGSIIVVTVATVACIALSVGRNKASDWRLDCQPSAVAHEGAPLVKKSLVLLKLVV